MGVEITFNPGPQIANPIRQEHQINTLKVPDAEEIAPFVAKAIFLLRRELDDLNIPLIGFAGAPITLAAYLIQGSGSKDFEVFRAFLRAEPQFSSSAFIQTYRCKYALFKYADRCRRSSDTAF